MSLEFIEKNKTVGDGRMKSVRIDSVAGKKRESKETQTAKKC